MSYLAARIVDVWPHLVRWKVEGYRRSVVPKAEPMMNALEDGYALLLPSSSSGSSGSRELMPALAAQSSEVAVTAAMVSALSKLQDRAGVDGSLPLMRYEGVPSTVLGTMIGHRMITTDGDEFGELRLALNHGTTESAALTLLAEPVLACQQGTGASYAKMSKFELLLRLMQEGWEESDRLPEYFELGGDMVHSGALSRPLSYFRALLSWDAIFGKGIEKIAHTAPDAYYKCLLDLPRGRVSAACADNVGQGNAFFVDHLKSALVDVGGEDPEQLGDGSREDGDEVCHELALIPLVPVQAVADGWQRCVVTDASGMSYKVYFDHFTGGTDKQRGYVNCPGRNCIKYHVCCGTYVSFCTSMYIWMERSRTQLDLSRQDLLTYWPTDVDIAAVQGSLEIVPF